MKRLLIIILLFSLSSCAWMTVSVKRTFPEMPVSLTTTCPDLKEVKENTEKLSELLFVVNDNYSLYHECQIKSESWVKWYDEQKKIFEDIK